MDIKTCNYDECPYHAQQVVKATDKPQPPKIGCTKSSCVAEDLQVEPVQLTRMDSAIRNIVQDCGITPMQLQGFIDYTQQQVSIQVCKKDVLIQIPEMYTEPPVGKKLPDTFLLEVLEKFEQRYEYSTAAKDVLQNSIEEVVANNYSRKLPYVWETSKAMTLPAVIRYNVQCDSFKDMPPTLAAHVEGVLRDTVWDFVQSGDTSEKLDFKTYLPKEVAGFNVPDDGWHITGWVVVTLGEYHWEEPKA